MSDAELYLSARRYVDQQLANMGDPPLTVKQYERCIEKVVLALKSVRPSGARAGRGKENT